MKRKNKWLYVALAFVIMNLAFLIAALCTMEQHHLSLTLGMCGIAVSIIGKILTTILFIQENKKL